MAKSKRKIRVERARGIRRGHRTRLSNGLEIEMVPGPPFGPGVVGADPRAVLAALERFDPEQDWAAARPHVLPMLPRLRPYPWQIEGLVSTMVPPGILVGFAIDLGPAFTFIGQQVLDRWGIDRPELVTTALSNVRRLAERCDPERIVHRMEASGGRLVQTKEGIASSLLLVPDLLPRFLGPGPHLLFAPMRDLLLALPPDVDRGLAAEMAEDLESLDPNCLHLGAFRHTSGTVVPEPSDDLAAVM